MNKYPIIDTHRHILGEDTLKLMQQAGVYDAKKPLPQVAENDGDLFVYQTSMDTETSIEVQRAAGVTKVLVSTGGEVELPARWPVGAGSGLGPPAYGPPKKPRSTSAYTSRR